METRSSEKKTVFWEYVPLRSPSLHFRKPYVCSDILPLVENARNYLDHPMITIRPHNPHDYAILPDIDDRQVQSLTKADGDCLDKLGNFLVVAQANDRFGASLLHRHFPVFTNELFRHARLAAT